MQFESIRWGIAILDLRLGNVQISQLIFVLAIPFLFQWGITTDRRGYQI
jgi:hypothetical protein